MPKYNFSRVRIVIRRENRVQVTDSYNARHAHVCTKACGSLGGANLS